MIYLVGAVIGIAVFWYGALQDWDFGRTMVVAMALSVCAATVLSTLGLT